MPKKKEGSQDLKGEFSVHIDIEKIENLSSGACFIHHSDVPNPDSYAICKEGKTIKIFKIVKE